MKKFAIALLTIGLLASTSLFAKTLIVSMHTFNQQSKVDHPIGTITITDSRYGLLIMPNLHGLVPGAHGFHIHEHPSCEMHGDAAGGHLDPIKTGKHLGPYNDLGHLGDLPALFVNGEGQANLVEIAPRLKVDDVLGHTFMIHQGGDNYADTPEKLGGGGPRIACGVIKASY